MNVIGDTCTLTIGAIYETKDFVLLVMLTSWLSTDLTVSDVGRSGLELLEYFAGKARITKLAIRRGYRARAVDVVYTKPKPPNINSFDKPRGSMDFNGCAGFTPLDFG